MLYAETDWRQAREVNSWGKGEKVQSRRVLGKERGHILLKQERDAKWGLWAKFGNEKSEEIQKPGTLEAVPGSVSSRH